VSGGPLVRPHLVEDDTDARFRGLPCGFASGEPGTDDVDGHMTIVGFGESWEDDDR
jgi:hypothetical protein